jgi:hypothetical protein
MVNMARTGRGTGLLARDLLVKGSSSLKNKCKSKFSLKKKS